MLRKLTRKKHEAVKSEIAANNKVALENYKRSGVVSQVEIRCTADSCLACKAMSGIYPIGNVPSLPNKNCTHEQGCRCCYLPVVD
jgi:hypothetical protein